MRCLGLSRLKSLEPVRRYERAAPGSALNHQPPMSRIRAMNNLVKRNTYRSTMLSRWISSGSSMYPSSFSISVLGLRAMRRHSVWL